MVVSGWLVVCGCQWSVVVVSGWLFLSVVGCFCLWLVDFVSCWLWLSVVNWCFFPVYFSETKYGSNDTFFFNFVPSGSHLYMWEVDSFDWHLMLFAVVSGVSFTFLLEEEKLAVILFLIWLFCAV